MKEDLKIIEGKGELIVKPTVEIDHHTCRQMRERIDLAFFEARPKTLVLDFSMVSFMDSSGIGLILGRVQKASMVGAIVEVRGLNDNLTRLVRLSGVEKIKNLTLK